MITVEEVSKQGLSVAGRGKKSDFIISTIADDGANNNINLTLEIKALLNKQLVLSNYVNDNINHFTVTYIILASNSDGVNWLEGKRFKRKEKNFTLSIKLADYEQFCNAEKITAKKIIAEQFLNAVQLHLPKEKDFDFPKFYTDLSELFHKQGWV